MEHHSASGAAGPSSPALSQDQVRARLREIALFEGLDEGHLEEILRVSEPVLVEADEYVFEEGDRGDHFYVIVRGEIELRKAAGDGMRPLATLGGGQAFGEMALLNQTSRSAAAYAVSDTYLLSISREAFSHVLGGETLGARLLRNLAKALWGSSARRAARQAEEPPPGPHEVLGDFNRLLRTRLLPRVTPRISGYDLAASTLTPRQGIGSSGWDWFLLSDGRPAFVVMKSVRTDIFSAQRLMTLRALLRAGSAVRDDSLGSLMTRASRGLRDVWVEGLSGPVACGLVALAEGRVEWVGAGDVAGMIVRPGGASRSLNWSSPAAGELPEHEYESSAIDLGARDKLICLSENPGDLVRLVTSVVVGGYTSSSRDALSKLFGRFAQGSMAGAPVTDLTGAVITCTRASI